MSMLKYFFIPVFLIIALNSYSQDRENNVVNGMIIDGDTIPMIYLNEVTVYGWKNMSRMEERKLTRLMRNVKIVYPYARLAGIKLVEYEDILAQAPDDKARRKIMKQLEDDLQAEYGQELRDLT